MADMSAGERVSISKLIFVPAIVTLAITILRLVGELQNWPSLLFRKSVGGVGSIVGITWLPFIFGPYFAVKLIKAGDRPSSAGKVIGLAILGLVLWLGGGFLAFAKSEGSLVLVLAGLVILAAGAVVQFPGWRGLAKVLMSYGYAARIPVAIIMYFAMAGNWGTHYDAVAPEFASMNLLTKWAFLGLAPQLILWITYTLSIGALFGGIAAAIVKGRRQKTTS